MSATCPECGKPIGPNAIQGLCPECMMRIGLGSGVQPGPSADGLLPPRKPEPFVPPTPAELAPLFPQLEILNLLGHGGMGAVYRARQKELDRIVALKILPPGIGQDPAFAERFAREARALAKLNHPGIVTLYEFGRVARPATSPGTGSTAVAAPLYYFLMEYVDGVNLRQLLHAGRIAPREALAIVPQICDALQYAHDQGIVHRDIKPENILLDRRGRVKVADFGVARLMAAEASAGELSEAGKIVGTPQYMAPEQIEHPDAVDHRADIYALGLVFYQMLTGEMPGKPIEPPSHKVLIDVRLDEVVLRALEKDPARRYSQVSVLKTQVETIAITPPLASPASAAAQAEASPRLSRTALAGAAWAALFFAAVTAVALFGTPYAGGHSLPAEMLLAMSRLVLGLAFSAVVGTTILGGLAVIQIRRSAGRLRGLGLAVFDSLCFPLLGVDLLLLKAGGAALANAAGYGLAVLLVFAALLAMDLLIGRVIWRTLRTPWREPGVAPRPVHRGLLGLAYGTLALGVVLVTSPTLFYWGRLVDNVNLPFVDDPRAIGRWSTVDYVDQPDQFQPESRRWRSEFYLKQMILLPGGKASEPWWTWTKGVIIHKGDRSASRYEIKQIKGTNYMFMEWKSGDWSLLRFQPGHYVLRWAGTGDQSGPAATPGK